MTPVCPCCGRPTPPGTLSAVEEVRALRLSPQATTIVETLAKDIGRWVPIQKIEQAVWGRYSDGGPTTARNVMAMAMKRVRHRLEAAGFKVETKYGGPCIDRSYRRLVRTEEARP